jgi:acetyl esterase/lipase
MKTNFVLLAVLGCLPFARGQDHKPFPLWAEGAPGALDTADKDSPTLTPFFPDPGKATGAAIVICPGGGYGGLALSYEGVDYARFLTEQGIAGFVLKYRLGSAGYRHPVMLQDAARAVRTVRARAEEWKLDKRVGIMGSSAGGHLASTLLTHYDAGKAESADLIERQSSRPDLGILCYPVVTMGRFTHQGSKSNLLGKDPSEELVRSVSNELQVTKDTPPCFIWHTWEDKTVAVENCLQFAQALRQAGVPFDLHIYQEGVHGLGLGSHEWDPAKRHPWTGDCIFWLKAQGFTR